MKKDGLVRIFIQINLDNNDWDFVRPKEVFFESRVVCAQFAQNVANVLDCKVRVTYPSYYWEPTEDVSMIKYCGNLSGSYFDPRKPKVISCQQ